MKFKITTLNNDGLREAPPIEVEISDSADLGSQLDWLFDAVQEELLGDSNKFIGVGGTLTIERTA